MSQAHLAPTPTGTEAAVCEDIARRQVAGVQKYGTTVAANPLPLAAWIRHAYEEGLDFAIYLKRAQSEIEGMEANIRDLRAQIRADWDTIRRLSEAANLANARANALEEELRALRAADPVRIPDPR